MYSLSPVAVTVAIIVTSPIVVPIRMSPIVVAPVIPAWFVAILV
jgi:hypothetical protein